MLIVLAVVLLPLLANFWISFKPVELADLRAPTVFVNEQVRGRPEAPGAEVTLEYRLRNSSQDQPIRSVVLEDALPPGLTPAEIDPRCTLEGGTIRCELGDVAAGFRDRLRLRFVTGPEYFDAAVDPDTSVALVSGTAENVLTSFSFTLENYRRVFEAREFWDVLRVTVLYTVFGTIGSLVLGLFAAQLLNASFRGRGLLRGLFLFPYVAPVIAVAFTWVFMLDPFSGTVNALTTRLGVAATPVNFLGTRSIDVSLFGLTFGFPLALAMVIAFESWRYFPLAFLFILARLQALPSDIYEAAEIDGATPLQTFWYVTLPQLVGILSVLFLLRFI